MVYQKTVGKKWEVYYGIAKHTAGGLTKKDLMVNKRGKVVSRLQHKAGKRLYRNYKEIADACRASPFR